MWVDKRGRNCKVGKWKNYFYFSSPLWWWYNVNEHKMWYFCRLLISFHEFHSCCLLLPYSCMWFSCSRLLHVILLYYECSSDNKYKWKIKGSYDDCSCQIFLLKDNGIEWVKVERWKKKKKLIWWGKENLLRYFMSIDFSLKNHR
jgi:hypothetical protein